MTFRKRSRFYKPKLRKVDVTSSEVTDRLEYLEDERRDEMIKLLPNKPAVRWWTRIGDKTEESFRKDSNLNIIAVTSIFTVAVALYESFKKLKIFDIYKFISIFGICIFLYIFIFIKSTYKEIYKVLEKDSNLSKLKILRSDIKSLIIFLPNVSVIIINIFGTINITIGSIFFFRKNPIINKLNNLVRKVLMFLSEDFKHDSIYLSFAIAPLYSLLLYKILMLSARDTLEKYDSKWKYYNSNKIVFSIMVYCLTVTSTLNIYLITKFTPTNDELSSFYNKVGANFFYSYLILILLYSADLIIANYKIDKKFIAEYEEKLKELQEFTARINHHRGIKISKI